MDLHKKRRDIFNIIFSIAFLGYVAAGVLFIGLQTIEEWVAGLDLWEIGILVFAVQRLVRLFVYDEITAFFRDIFLHVQLQKDGSISRSKFDSGFKRSVSDVLLCPWCFSVWSTVTIVFMVIMLPGLGYLIATLLAISGLASILQISANAIGWTAENKKIDAQMKSQK